ncbi:hypothetical protein DIPPA_02412 [Diplonema papillatum]|nr:hypothetical protein DIPPA_02412 [Diplonema papillatum]
MQAEVDDAAERLKYIDLVAFQKIADAVVDAMEQGNVADCLREHGVPGMIFVVAPHMQNPERDGRARGVEQILMAYNALVPLRFPPNLTWEFRQEVRQIAPTVFEVDQFSKEPIGERRERVTYFLRDGLITHIMSSPQTPEEISTDYMDQVTAFKAAGVDTEAAKPPCWHNSWDSVRGRSSCTVLRCRECSSVWKLKAAEFQDWRCPDFHHGCHYPEGQCRRVHIHARKLRVHERGNKPAPHPPEPGPADSGAVAEMDLVTLLNTLDHVNEGGR